MVLKPLAVLVVIGTNNVPNKTKPMKKFLVPILFITTLVTAYGQDDATVEAISDEISGNLDLDAVASFFADAEDLESFEKALNNPEEQVSNLDLNQDDQVDYIRVMESTEEDTHLIALQAVLGEDTYQDVATIEVEKDAEGEPTVQIVGDVYIYGPDYIIEPVYVYRPRIFSVFWRPRYRPYRSVYRWGYYPRYWRVWRPMPLARYRNHVVVHVNVQHTYRRTYVRRSTRAVRLHTAVRRSDYARLHPNRSYTARRVAVSTRTGAKMRTTTVRQADGDRYKSTTVRSANGTERRVAGVNKPNGTKKRVAKVENPDGSSKTVAVRKNPNGSARAVSVTKNTDGGKTIKTARKSAKGAKVKRKKSAGRR